MLVDADTPPERNLYYVGARVIQLLRDDPFSAADLDLAYHRINSGQVGAKNIPFGYFLLALDWLYLIGAVDISAEGDIIRCF